ncbi:vacuolar protein sorting-associated protein 52 homolog [Galendromus occidentalis]|uniref:Vacuolar protein sorting-associated protein 52 homolog n=1 Tax=Galendromus occidentalis TaxID=34638 RepID=A0AAJ6QYD9_9ACAR|nr:vacuolar protein sorting-associated protein 52 homolog [Galendromus occidentalis]
MADPLAGVDGHIQENLCHDVIKEALESGRDLREYSRSVDQQLKGTEDEAIKDYMENCKDIAALHNEIASCDGILQVMENILRGFQNDLGSISSEIQSLQRQSVAMNLQLKNRQAVKGELSQFVDDFIVPESTINVILDCPVTDEEFLAQLSLLDQKISFVKVQSFKEASSCQDVKDILDKLKVCAVTKIREWLLQKVFSFRKPNANFQLPQNAMLKHKLFFQFLATHEREVAKEVREEYVNTMSKVYYSYFKAYHSRLMKLQFDDVPDKDDLMGVDDTPKWGLFNKPSLKNRSTIFTLGNRNAVMSVELEAPVIVPHASAKNEKHYPFEQLFRSMQYALCDNAAREYLFISEFFLLTKSGAAEAFDSIMGKSMSMFAKYTETFVAECFDSIALFLCIHVVHKLRILMHQRNVPVLDSYWDVLVANIFPRFETILRLNINSIRDCDPSKLGSIDNRPHYITRRYAEFSAAIVSINENHPDERVSILLGQLQMEVENFILKMAAEFNGRKDQLIFLINNYDMMLGVLQQRTHEDSKETTNFRTLLTARQNEYVEQILTIHFGGMMTFIKECEFYIEKGQSEKLEKESHKVATLVRGFNSGWKKAIDDMNADFMKTFTNFKCGTNILQEALKQLLQYYHRFNKVVSQPPLNALPVRSELINIHHLMVDIKKYKATF